MQAADDGAVSCTNGPGPAQPKHEVDIIFRGKVDRPVTRCWDDVDGWKASPVTPEHGVGEKVSFTCEQVRKEALPQRYEAGGGGYSVCLDPEALRVP